MYSILLTKQAILELCIFCLLLKLHPIALKIAGSGLSYGHLKCVYDRIGVGGLAVLMKAKVNGRIRVTTRNDKFIM